MNIAIHQDNVHKAIPLLEKSELPVPLSVVNKIDGRHGYDLSIFFNFTKMNYPF